MKSCAALPESLAYEADELLNTAIMTGIPIVIVEGHHDVPIYERLALSINKDCEIYASENILASQPGCSGVESNLTEIRKYAQDIPVESYILGIVDRDARFYRNERIEDPAILTLEIYSIETHFVSSEAVRFLIDSTTRATRHLVTPADADIIFIEIQKSLEGLYIYSLEALRNACEKDYKSQFGYSDRIKAIISERHAPGIEAKRQALLEFGSRTNIPSGWNGILAICKGKWLLELFIDEFRKQISKLPEYCADNIISQCQSCIRNTHKNCLYKLAANFDTPQLKQILYQDTSQPKLGYIKDRLASLI